MFIQLDDCPCDNPDFCFIDQPYPDALLPVGYRMARGFPMKGEYPADATVQMQPDEPGMQLPDLIGNTSSMLVVSPRFKTLLEEHQCGALEFLPLRILNHKGRLAADNYWIINSLEKHDVLHEQAADVTWFEGKVVTINKLVLDADKLPKDLDIFRLAQNPEWVLLSTRFLRALQQLEPPATNIVPTAIPVRDAEGHEVLV